MKHKTRGTLPLLIISLFFVSITGAAFAKPADFLVEEAWIAEAPAVSRVMVAYMTMVNPGTESIEIVSAESASYSSIEFHETRYEDGMARMLRHDSLNITPGNRLQLKRGGLHLMLFNPVTPLSAGDIVDITMTTKTGDSKTVSITVKKPFSVTETH